MLNHKNIEIKLNTDFKNINPSEYDRNFYTGPIDEYFDYKLGELPYRSVNFKFETFNKPYFQ
jgi:UDP-galactopyranose mutase